MQAGRKHPVHHTPHPEADGKSIIVFLTVCSKDKKRIFASHGAHELILSSWKQADAWLIGRYLLMPDHIHLFCSPRSGMHHSLSQWVRYWKSIYTQKSNRETGLQKTVWQRDYWDTQLRNNEKYAEKWQYVTNNSVRAGLVTNTEAWPYQGELNVLEY